MSPRAGGCRDAAPRRHRHRRFWEAHEGIRPLLPGEDLRAGREQLSVRRDASQPWLADLLLTPSRDGLWVFKKDGRVTRPLDRVGDERDGIRFLRPQVALLHMAHLGRSKDDADFRSLLPRLGPDDRAWLDEALALWRPDRHSRQALR